MQKKKKKGNNMYLTKKLLVLKLQEGTSTAEH